MPFTKLFSSNRLSRYLKLILLLCDLIILNIIYLVSVKIKFGDFEMVWKHEILNILIISNLIWIILVSYYDSYKLIRIEHIDQLIGKTIRVILLHLGIIAFCIILLKYTEISRFRMLVFYGLFAVVSIIFRIIFLKYLKYIRSQGVNIRLVVIVGANKAGYKISQILSSDLSYGYKILGFFDEKVNEPMKNKLQYLGKFQEIEMCLQKNDIHEMYIALHFSESDQITNLIHLCEKYMVRVKFVPDFQEYTKSRKVNIDFYENIPVLMLRDEPLSFPLNRITKRLFDILFSLLVILLVFTWLFPVLIIMIKLASRGPAFFKQERSGENNNPFICYKFRSMKLSNQEFIQASHNDPRITKIGRIIRKTSIDELPQFFNVFLGQMTVVGPRPHPLKLDDQYKALINAYLVRHYAKPGITGWAQVNGFRGETKELIDMQNRIEYDIWYIENWSFLLDLKIIWQTMTNVFRGEKNAY
jgi:undecaprenyl-phosphate galactose phosphotransferase/putative colanic acid biosynthesis UDP-glucose lipid carrier transferase